MLSLGVNPRHLLSSAGATLGASQDAAAAAGAGGVAAPGELSTAGGALVQERLRRERLLQRGWENSVAELDVQGGVSASSAAADAAASIWKSLLTEKPASIGGAAEAKGLKTGLLERVAAAADDEDDLVRAAGWHRTRPAARRTGPEVDSDGEEDIAVQWQGSLGYALPGAAQAKHIGYEGSGEAGAQAVRMAPSAPLAGAAALASLGGGGGGLGADWNEAVREALLDEDEADDATLASAAAAKAASSAAVSRRRRDEWAVTARMTAAQLDAEEARRTPALTFPFRLDDFQREAVAHVEGGRSVFVAAHTSAGKTVVAEYAIAMCARNCTRCVYTSPIKALSNQKYRDFKDKFGDVGLVTGDVSVDPDASCLVMTTEILRSMLYKGADLVRDIEWVIFDEVHYVNDSERGVVWEETIILLPDHVGMVFLSATTPNTVEFCEWIGRTKRRPVHVVTTAYRPVPLSHSLWAKGELFGVLGPDGKFRPEGREGAAVKLSGKKAAARLAAVPTRGGRGRGRGGRGRWGGHRARGTKDQWTSLVRWLSKEEITPAVVFLFSKQQCIDTASMLRSVSLLTAAESGRVRGFVDSAASRLRGSDKRLPQLLWLRELLSKGVGVHHGGLLPLLKEVVEILFGQGLVKVLFATETFAMGVNMPARTVVFGSTRKHDGTGFRDLLPGEYTQMAGRAGRRGLDTVGTVILACFGDEPAEVWSLQRMLMGKPAKLQSKFRLTYPMLLSLLRVEDLSVADMMRQSYSEFAAQRAIAGGDLPALMARGAARLRSLDTALRAEPCIKGGKSAIQEYYDTVTAAAAADRHVVEELLADEALREQTLAPGRIITVSAPLPRDLPNTRPRLLPGVVLALDQATAATPWGVVVLVVAPRGYEPRSGAPSEAVAPSAAVPGAEAARAPAPPSSRLLGASLLGERSQGPQRGGLLDAMLGGSTSSRGGPAAAVGEIVSAKVTPGWQDEVGSRTVAVLALPGSSVVRLFGVALRGVRAELLLRQDEGDSAAHADAAAPAKGFGRSDSGGGLLGFGGGGAAKKAGGRAGGGRKGRRGRAGGGGEAMSPAAAMADTVSKLLDVLSTAEAQLEASGAAESAGYEQGVSALLPPFDPAEQLAASSRVTLLDTASRAMALWARVQAIKCAECASLPRQWELVARRARLLRQLRLLRKRVGNESLKLFPELSAMSEVLRRLAYVHRDEEAAALAEADAAAEGGVARGSVDLSSLVVELKGRVACEIQSGHALVLTEMIFEGVLAPLEPEEVAALLCALICQEKGGDGKAVVDRLPPALAEACHRTEEIARAVGRVQLSCGLDSDEEAFVESCLNFSLSEAVLEWAQGTTFEAITSIVPRIPEGSIVRTITRLDNTCREVRGAARIIGDPQLFKKADAASAAIKRDIVFAASLYVS